MRTIGAILIGTVMFFVGLFSLSYQGQNVESTVNNSTSPNADAAYNMTNDVLGGIGQAGGQSLAWVGVAAIILVSLGFLAYNFSGGR